jgi:predicted DNA-binding transcriptional regulator YafY
MRTSIDPSRVVDIVYTNGRGETRPRRIQPIAVEWGSNQWHTEPQWLLTAVDAENGQVKTFAMKDIHLWVPAVHELTPDENTDEVSVPVPPARPAS